MQKINFLFMTVLWKFVLIPFDFTSYWMFQIILLLFDFYLKIFYDNFSWMFYLMLSNK